MTQTLSVSFVILNYNGKEITERCINSLINSIKDIDYEIIVVDNGSNDGSAYYLESKFNFIKVINKRENKYISAYNDGVKEAKNQWVFLLNNDMTFEDGFLTPILEHLFQDNIFAVGSKMLKENKDFEKCANIPSFKYGYLWIKSVDVNEFLPSIYIGAHGVFNRDEFLEIGGFDDIYSPFYSEDLDLCYRAWKRGWMTYIEPRSIIYHKHMATINKFFSRDYILRINARNHLIFLWKNLSSIRLILSHVFFLPFLLVGSFTIGKSYYISAFFESLKYLKRISKERFQESRKNIKTDEEILLLFKHLS